MKRFFTNKNLIKSGVILLASLIIVLCALLSTHKTTVQTAEMDTLAIEQVDETSLENETTTSKKSSKKEETTTTEETTTEETQEEVTEIWTEAETEADVYQYNEQLSLYEDTSYYEEPTYYEETTYYEEPVQETTAANTQTSLFYTGWGAVYDYVTPEMFKGIGTFYWQGYSWTYYSEKVLPGDGLSIPGRYSDGTFVRDCYGNLCLASSDLPYGTLLTTPWGTGCVYDCGCNPGVIDVYVSW